MKLCHYRLKNEFIRSNRLGVLENDKIIDLNLFWETFFKDQGFYFYKEMANRKIPSSLSEFLKISSNPISELKETLEEIAKSNIDENYFIIEFEQTLLNAPIDKINCYRDFYAHEKHVAKGFEKRKEPIPEAWYEIPAYYKGPTTGFIGTNSEILWPSYTKVLDYELELGMIVSRSGKNIKSEYAIDHILGWTILNDISARDIQKKEMAVRLGPAKGKDFCSVIGPVITTQDEFGKKEPNLEMIARIDGEEWSRGKSGDAHFNFSQMIEHVSRDEWVIAGDLFGSGTVGTGCGLELDRWIKPGQIIELEIENIGILRNQIGAPE